MEYFRKSADEVCSAVNSSPKGLSEAQAEERKQKYGKNLLDEQEKMSPLAVFLDQFKDLLIFILIAAGIISMFSGQIESTVVIFAVIILNAVLGTVQHFKAEKSLEGLKKLSAPSAKVLRDGKRIEIPSEDIVPGDILMLEAGDLVTADARIIENYSLKVNESSLTGESEAVEKCSDIIAGENVPLGDRKNMVYSGSLVTYGRASAVVVGTGMNTEIGKIAQLLNQTQQRKTPLQVSLDNFSKKLAIMIMIVSAVVFGLSIYNKMGLLDAMLFAVALAVAAIPEALSSIVTIVLAIGTRAMAAENAVVKDLKSVESLGCVSVICSDKTGTLTQNRMVVQDMFASGDFFDSESMNLENRAHYMLLKSAVLANDADIEGESEIGDPTETALLQMASKFGIIPSQYRSQHPRIAELSFDSDRKLMSTVHSMDGKNIICTKGAVDVMLPRINSVLTKDGVIPMSAEEEKKITAANRKMSEKGLRVLAFAIKSLGNKNEIDYNDEDEYTFVGLISMMDPPRDEAISAVADAKRGGITTIMITGDHKITAAAIAAQIGIMEEGDLALEGTELDKMTDEELSDKLERVKVYARVSPEHKIRIVDLWQKKGKIVSMTGDGVNDAPALKQADIGVAMGITGTEVAKDASSMILTDDNFATIVKAIINGRGVYANIKNAIIFLLSGNLAAILCVLYTSLAALPVPFLAVHLLFINLLTDSLPAIAIGMEPVRSDLLNNPPRDPNESILNKKSLGLIAFRGLLIGAAVIWGYFIGYSRGDGMAATMAFSILTLARLFHGFNCRAEGSIFKLGFKSNPSSVGAFFLGALLLAAVLFIPALHGAFMITALSGTNILEIIVLAFMPTFVIQTYKVVREVIQNK